MQSLIHAVCKLFWFLKHQQPNLPPEVGGRLAEPIESRASRPSPPPNIDLPSSSFLDFLEGNPQNIRYLGYTLDILSECTLFKDYPQDMREIELLLTFY